MPAEIDANLSLYPRKQPFSITGFLREPSLSQKKNSSDNINAFISILDRDRALLSGKPSLRRSLQSYVSNGRDYRENVTDFIFEQNQTQKQEESKQEHQLSKFLSLSKGREDIGSSNDTWRFPKNSIVSNNTSEYPRRIDKKVVESHSSSGPNGIRLFRKHNESTVQNPLSSLRSSTFITPKEFRIAIEEPEETANAISFISPPSPEDSDERNGSDDSDNDSDSSTISENEPFSDLPLNSISKYVPFHRDIDLKKDRCFSGNADSNRNLSSKDFGILKSPFSILSSYSSSSTNPRKESSSLNSKEIRINRKRKNSSFHFDSQQTSLKNRQQPRLVWDQEQQQEEQATRVSRSMADYLSPFELPIAENQLRSFFDNTAEDSAVRSGSFNSFEEGFLLEHNATSKVWINPLISIDKKQVSFTL